MDIVKDLEAMRKRIIQEINTEFDLLIERVASEPLPASTPIEEVPYECKYHLQQAPKFLRGQSLQM